MGRMPVRSHPQQPLAPEGFRGALVLAIGDDGEIDLVAVDALEQIHGRLADHGEFDAGIDAREARHDLGQIAVGIIVGHAQAHAAGQFGVGEGRQRLDVELDDAARVIEQALAILGELGGAAVAREDRPLEPDVKTNILRSQLDMARESGYMGTSFHGDNAVFMYLGDWERGLSFDWAGTYEYLRKNAMDPNGPRPYLDEYIKNGWIADFIPPENPSPPYAGGKAGAATTLEYSWDDYAMAQYAKRLGKEDDAAMFLKRAHNYRPVFDTSVD